MHNTRWFALFMIWAAVALFALGLLNLVINTEQPASWAPLMLLMPVSFVEDLRRLKTHRLKSRRR